MLSPSRQFSYRIEEDAAIPAPVLSYCCSILSRLYEERYWEAVTDVHVAEDIYIISGQLWKVSGFVPYLRASAPPPG